MLVCFVTAIPENIEVPLIWAQWSVVFTGLGLVGTAHHLHAFLAQEPSVWDSSNSVPKHSEVSGWGWSPSRRESQSHSLQWAFPQLPTEAGTGMDCSPQTYQTAEHVPVWCWTCFKWHWGSGEQDKEADARSVASLSEKKNNFIQLCFCVDPFGDKVKIK